MSVHVHSFCYYVTYGNEHMETFVNHLTVSFLPAAPKGNNGKFPKLSPLIFAKKTSEQIASCTQRV